MNSDGKPLKTADFAGGKTAKSNNFPIKTRIKTSAIKGLSFPPQKSIIIPTASSLGEENSNRISFSAD